jgi:NAD(P)-dependent dehydrogenase (short-subunit alcohol dehydrogenase family)
MSNILKNKVVVITGAGGGIGKAISLKLASENATIILLGGNNIEKLKSTESEVKEKTICYAIPGNLTSMDFLKSSIEHIIEKFNQIDILINNAGIAINSPFENIKEEDFDKIMNINVKVPFFLSQLAIPLLKKSNWATIVNISSIVAYAGYPLQSAYVASKHALQGFTKSIASEYYKDNIRVHAICPGGVYTDMVKVSRPDLSKDGMIMPEDIANIVHFLLTNRNNAIIDEVLVHRANKEPFLV